MKWAEEPPLFTPDTLPGDRILTGFLRNDSVRRVRVDLPDVRVLARNGDRVAAAPVFLNTFGKSLWSPGRAPTQMPDSELLRTGRIAFLRPGERSRSRWPGTPTDGDASSGRLRGGVASGPGVMLEAWLTTPLTRAQSSRSATALTRSSASTRCSRSSTSRACPSP